MTGPLVRLGCLSSVAATFLPGVLRAFRAQCPEVQVDVVDLESYESVAALDQRLIDLAVVFELPGRGPGVDYRGQPVCPDAGIVRIALYDEPYVAVVPTGHALAALPSAPFTRLDRLAFLGTEMCPGNEQLVAAGLDVDFVAYDGVDTSLLGAAVSTSGALALAPADQATAPSSSLRTVRLRDLGLHRRVCAAFVRDAELDEETRTLLAALMAGAALRPGAKRPIRLGRPRTQPRRRGPHA